MSLQAVILAGGLGTRLGQFTSEVPKALVKVAGEPFIAHQLKLLRANEIRRVVLCISHMADMITDFVGDGRRFDVEVEYSFDGPVRLGTAGAIRHATALLDEEFFVVYGDSYLPCDYAVIAAAFRNSGKLAMMTVFCNQGQWDNSNVEFSAGEILAYDKKNPNPRMHFIDYGLGVFKRDAFTRLAQDEPYDLAELYQDLLAQRQLTAYEVTQRFYEIGSVAGLNELSTYLTLHT